MRRRDSGDGLVTGKVDGTGRAPPAGSSFCGHKTPFRRRHMILSGIWETRHMVIFILSFLGIVIAYLTAETAERRGRSMKAWMWLGLIFGPFAWLTVALLPSIRKEQTV
jgi:hypothetical protein